jgi:beta-phosphoglucomutase-like phosphatase (HAD superfamily)
MLKYSSIDISGTAVLLCDADGNLFPSEEPAFVASTIITNRFMREYGLERQFTPTELRLTTTGKNFRTTVIDLAVSFGIPLAPDLTQDYAGQPLSLGNKQGNFVIDRPMFAAAALEYWVAEEKREVSSYLGKTLRPDPEVIGPLTELNRRFGLAAVSSSAISRLAACFEAANLDLFFPTSHRFSAEDSLPIPKSKPDPAIYTFAGKQLGINPSQAIAIEDSGPGAQAAVAAGYQTIGNIMFVQESERTGRVRLLKKVGVVAIVESWWELVKLLRYCQVGEAEEGQI